MKKIQILSKKKKKSKFYVSAGTITLKNKHKKKKIQVLDFHKIKNRNKNGKNLSKKIFGASVLLQHFMKKRKTSKSIKYN